MFGRIKIIQKLRQDLKELKAIQEKAQEIDDKLKKSMHENKEIFSGLSVDQDDDAKQHHLTWQEQEIINEIQDLEYNGLEYNFDQLTQQSEDKQLVHSSDKQSSEDLSNKLNSMIQETNSLDLKKNKTPLEFSRGVLKGDFGRKKTDRFAVLMLLFQIVKISAFLEDKLALVYLEYLAKQYKEELGKMQNQLVELRRKTENYYDSFHSSS